jgi:hypothetical protein
MNSSSNSETLNEVHITKLLTSSMIVNLLEMYPNLEKITCPKSLYDRIPKKYLDALKNLDIVVEIKYTWGRKSKYDDEIGQDIVERLAHGQSASSIADDLNISVKTVYYLKDKYSKGNMKLKRGIKTKYDDSTIKKIKQYYNNGIAIREIADAENIPLRTVYFISKGY